MGHKLLMRVMCRGLVAVVAVLAGTMPSAGEAAADGPVALVFTRNCNGGPEQGWDNVL